MCVADILSCVATVTALTVWLINCAEGIAEGLPSTALNITGIAGRSLLLNCTIGSHQGHVTWLRPGDSAVMSRDYSILNVEGERRHNRLVVVGDFSKGEFHLLIRYTLFPQDAGTWLCTSEPVTRTVNVVLLVRPNTEVPSISPGDASAVKEYHDSGNASGYKTFTCTGHFAFPPVQLMWVKEFGPDAAYHVTLTSVVVSRSGTMSSSIRLILSSSNAGSLFVCSASHPTFFGKVYSSSLQFHLSGNANPQPLVQESDGAKMLARSSPINLDKLDRVFLLLVIVIVLAAFTVGLLMNKFNSKWELDVPLDRIDQNLNTKALCEVVDGEKVKRRESTKGRRRFTHKVLSGLVLLFLLITSLVFAFPIFFKSVTIPTVDADEIASVMAGSALWLDCRMLVQPSTSVLEINWLYNGEPFYHQYYTNTQNIGFPHNSTRGFMIGVRVSSQDLGQITIWPVAPGEDGRYACQAFVSSGDTGVAEERGKSTAVFVLMGPVVNYALIGVLALALMSSLGLLLLFIYHSLRIPHKEEDDKADDEDV